MATQISAETAWFAEALGDAGQTEFGSGKCARSQNDCPYPGTGVNSPSRPDGLPHHPAFR
jgi:hypothetical protein